MRNRRTLSRVIVGLMLLALLAIAGYVLAALVRQPPIVNIEADLNQAATALPAEVIREGLDVGGFRGRVYDTSEYDLIAEKVQDTKDARDISVGVTARPIDPVLLPEIVSLGTVSEQPLLFVTRSDSPALASPADLLGRRIQIGLIGSVSNDVGTKVLAEFGVTPENSTFLTDKIAVATASLINGSADAMIELYSPGDSELGTLLQEAKVRLIPMPSARAVAGRIGYIVSGTLPQGAFSVQRMIPPADIPVITVPITVIAHEGLSRAAVYEIAYALNNRFSQGTVLADPGTFPSFTHTIPSDPAAVEVYDSGSIPWQYRMLPSAIADLFIPLALASSILLILISFYQVLLPDALHLWTGVLKPRRVAKKSRKHDQPTE